MNIKQQLFPLAVAFTALGTLSACGSSSNSYDKGALSEADFAQADSVLTDADFAVGDNGAATLTDADFAVEGSAAATLTDADFNDKPQLSSPNKTKPQFVVAAINPEYSLYATAVHASLGAQPLIILPNTAPTTTQAFNGTNQTRRGLESEGMSAGDACVEGAKRTGLIAGAGAFVVTGLDLLFTGGTITMSSLMLGSALVGIKGASVGCLAGAVTNNPNAGISTPNSLIKPAGP